MTVHFDNSFFAQPPELSFHKPSLVIKEEPFQHHFFALWNEKLHVVHKGDAVPAEAETDLRKIRDFVCNHLEEIGQLPLSKNDNPLQRILDRVSAIDILIGKRNDYIENHLYTMMIRIISIFLLIVTLGLYNYKNSFRIDPILWLATEKLSSLLDKADSRLWAEKKLPDQDRLLVRQKLIDSFRNQDKAKFQEILKEHPQLQKVITGNGE